MVVSLWVCWGLLVWSSGLLRDLAGLWRCGGSAAVVVWRDVVDFTQPTKPSLQGHWTYGAAVVVVVIRSGSMMWLPDDAAILPASLRAAAVPVVVVAMVVVWLGCGGCSVEENGLRIFAFQELDVSENIFLCDDSKEAPRGERERGERRERREGEG